MYISTLSGFLNSFYFHPTGIDVPHTPRVSQCDLVGRHSGFWYRFGSTSKYHHDLRGIAASRKTLGMLLLAGCGAVSFQPIKWCLGKVPLLACNPIRRCLNFVICVWHNDVTEYRILDAAVSEATSHYTISTYFSWVKSSVAVFSIASVRCEFIC